MAGWNQGNGASWNEEGKLESNAPRVRLCSQDDSRTHNEGQTPGGDVFSSCGNQGYDSDF